MIKVAGQGPHAWKYSSEGLCGQKCKHQTVANEDEMISLFTSFNAYNDADDVELTQNGVSDGTTLGGLLGMIANSQFYSHHPLPDRLTQHPPPTLDSLRAKGYIDPKGRVVPKAYASFYHGDWDGAAWIYNYFDQCWNDPARGSVPIGWVTKNAPFITFLPLLCSKPVCTNHCFSYGDSTTKVLFSQGLDSEISRRFPPAFALAYSTATPNDTFIMVRGKLRCFIPSLSWQASILIGKLTEKAPISSTG